jgi:uncharacterized DUF497 family protein
MTDDVEWDLDKASDNFKKHGVDFADAALVLDDDRAITIREDEPGEERYVTVGMDLRCASLSWSTRGATIGRVGFRRARLRRATRTDQPMKTQYNLTGGKRGAVLKTAPGKTRITIRLDEDILEWFRKQAHAAGGGNYQTLINAALREYVGTKRESLEATLRRVLREELPHDLKRTASR